MHRHNLKSVSLTHIFGVKFANFDWKKKDEQKAKSSICMLQFQFRLFASTLHTSTTDSWNCGEPCCWCLQLEDKLRVRPQRIGKLLVENKAELNLQSLAAQWNADSNQTENCTQSVLHMSFFQVQGRIPKGWNRPIFWPKTPMWKGAAAVPCGDMMAVLPSTFLCSRTQCILKRSLLGDVFRNTWDSILNSGGASLEANILNFFWNSLVVVAPTRPPATGHHESVLWKSTQHTAELVAYHGVTPVSKQPCERQRHGCCPAQWIWDTVYDECYKGGQPDLSLLLLAGELYLRDAAQAPPFFWRAPLTRSNTSTVHSACKAWAGRNLASRSLTCWHSSLACWHLRAGTCFNAFLICFLYTSIRGVIIPWNAFLKRWQMHWRQWPHVWDMKRMHFSE